MVPQLFLNCRWFFSESVWKAVVLAVLGVRRQAERSLSIPKGKAIAQSAALGGLVEKQVDNRWSKCIVVKYVQENGISFTLLCARGDSEMWPASPERQHLLSLPALPWGLTSGVRVSWFCCGVNCSHHLGPPVQINPILVSHQQLHQASQCCMRKCAQQ